MENSFFRCRVYNVSLRTHLHCAHKRKYRGDMHGTLGDKQSLKSCSVISECCTILRATDGSLGSAKFSSGIQTPNSSQDDGCDKWTERALDTQESTCWESWHGKHAAGNASEAHNDCVEDGVELVDLSPTCFHHATAICNFIRRQLLGSVKFISALIVHITFDSCQVVSFRCIVQPPVANHEADADGQDARQAACWQKFHLDTCVIWHNGCFFVN